MDYLERVAAEDGAMRRVLRVAQHWGGVRPTQFLGDPTVIIHRDAAGNVTGTTTIPGWTAEDREWALALDAYEARLCPRGHDTVESMAKENTWAYRAPLLGACHACHAQDVEAERWKDHDLGSVMLYEPAHIDPERVVKEDAA